MAWVVSTMGRRITCPFCNHVFERVLPYWYTHIECPSCIKEFKMVIRVRVL